MSELIKNGNNRLEEFVSFSKKLIEGGNGKNLIDEYEDLLASITAAEVMQVFDSLLASYPLEKVKQYAGKLVNTFFKALDPVELKVPNANHFTHYLVQENRAVEKHMQGIRAVVKKIGKSEKLEEEYKQELLPLIRSVKEYEIHYLKKENILFPYIENTFPEYRCLQIMWSFHDDFRVSIRELETILHAKDVDIMQMHAALGKLFFVVYPIIFREEKIVFPVALKAIPTEAWDKMLLQAIDIGWCYGVRPKLPDGISVNENRISGKIYLGSGFLSVEQLMLLFKNLPVDITLVDEEDEVCFFSEGKERIFPRSVAIIGRKVHNCHPPESVHIVNEIVMAFRNGTKSEAEFWIQMGGRFIHIRYFAIHDEQSTYKGTMEVSQDVTGIRKLEGQQKLLDWST